MSESREQALQSQSAVKAIVMAILLTTGNGQANEDRIVWAALTADTVLKCAGVPE